MVLFHTVETSCKNGYVPLYYKSCAGSMNLNTLMFLRYSCSLMEHNRYSMHYHLKTSMARRLKLKWIINQFCSSFSASRCFCAVRHFIFVIWMGQSTCYFFLSSLLIVRKMLKPQNVPPPFPCYYFKFALEITYSSTGRTPLTYNIKTGFGLTLLEFPNSSAKIAYC